MPVKFTGFVFLRKHQILLSQAAIIGSVSLYLCSLSFSIKSLDRRSFIAFCAPPMENWYFSRNSLAYCFITLKELFSLLSKIN